MQKITVLCVGKLKEAFYEQAAREYEKRLSRCCKLALLELPEKLRDIIVARYYYGFRFAKIGEMMDISEANARVSHARALEKLKEIIVKL